MSSIQFHPDGRWVLAGFRAASIPKMWDVVTGKQVLTGGMPWGFSADGRTFAAGGHGDVAFCDLHLPQALRPLSGHRASITKLVWCRDNRHLASLDSRFEVRVWDVARAETIDTFHAPRSDDDLYSHNAAVALSDDARTVAFASGGDREATALMHDVKEHTKLGPWPLPGGYEQLAYANGKFLLVREEDAEEVKPGDRRPTHAMAYEWVVGQPPARLREIRPSEPGDLRRFLLSGLTPDARYYWWSGPRRPEANRRVEVREIATGRLVTKVSKPTRPPHPEIGAILGPDGRYLWITENGENCQLYDLTVVRPPERFSDYLSAFSPASRWLVFAQGPDEQRAAWTLVIRRWGEDRAWLELGNSDLSVPNPVSFSPDGRYLAWGSENGTITVADLPALQQQVRRFEKAVLPK